MLSTLAATATERYIILEDKYPYIIHFFTHHDDYLPKTDSNIQSHLIPSPSQKADERPRERNHMNTVIRNNSLIIKQDFGWFTNYSRHLEIQPNASEIKPNASESSCRKRRSINPEAYPINDDAEIF